MLTRLFIGAVWVIDCWAFLAGQVRVSPFPGKKLEHNGIRVLLIGQIELAAEKGHYYDFLSLGECQLAALLHAVKMGDI